jgi:hypothetical protein
MNSQAPSDSRHDIWPNRKIAHLAGAPHRWELQGGYAAVTGGTIMRVA